MKHKKILIISFCVAAVLAVPLTAVAYLRYKPQATENKVSVQYVKENIQETFPAVEKQLSGVNTFPKEVSVKNTGIAICYARVYMNFSDSEIRALSSLSNSEGDNDFKSWNDYLSYYRKRFPLKVVEDSGDGEWIYVPSGEDLGGYFYYTKPLKPDDSTPTILKQVRVDYNGNEDAVSDFELIVYSEMVQAVDDDGKLLTCEKAWKSFLNIQP